MAEWVVAGVAATGLAIKASQQLFGGATETTSSTYTTVHGTRMTNVNEVNFDKSGYVPSVCSNDGGTFDSSTLQSSMRTEAETQMPKKRWYHIKKKDKTTPATQSANVAQRHRKRYRKHLQRNAEEKGYQ